jgi:uncharacterized surface protein with fasciclin (FAS1) repeats
MQNNKTLPANSPVYTANLVDTAAANGTFVTFGKVVEQAGLSDTLRGVGPFTVFAPTDAAFAAMPAGKLDELLKPERKAELVSLVNYHMLKGNQPLADIRKWDSARTMQGQMAPIKLKEKAVSIDGATVVAADIGASNGVLHGIDKVNVPTKH